MNKPETRNVGVLCSCLKEAGLSCPIDILPFAGNRWQNEYEAGLEEILRKLFNMNQNQTKIKTSGMSTIHEIAKSPEFREKLKSQLSGAFQNRLNGIVERIASLDDFFILRGEYDIYLDEARWSYFYGFFIAAINLSCVCAERVLIDLIMDANIKVNEHILSAEEKETAFSYQLQSKRIKFADSFHLIDRKTSKNFQKLDKYQHKYIHPNNPVYQYNIGEDAKDAIYRLHEIVKSTFPLLIEPTEKEELKQKIFDIFKQDKI